MHDITKVKVGNESECSYKNFPANREFKKRASDDVDLEITVTLNDTEPGKSLSYSKITAENMKITEGSVKGVCAKLAVGVIPKVVIKYFLSYTPGYSDHATVTDLVYMFRYGERLELVYCIGDSNTFHQHTVRLNMDGTYIDSETPKKLAFESSV